MRADSLPSIVLGDWEYKDKGEIFPAVKGPTAQETNDVSNSSSGKVVELLTFIEGSLCAQHCPKCIYIF